MLLNYALKIVVGFGGAIAIRRRLAGGAKVALATTTTRLEEFVRRSDVFQAALGDARTMMRILGESRQDRFMELYEEARGGNANGF